MNIWNLGKIISGETRNTTKSLVNAKLFLVIRFSFLKLYVILK